MKLELKVEAAVANPYLAADGLVNFAAIDRLQASIAKIIKADKEGAIKITSTFVMPRRAKPVPYSAAKAAKKDLKYLAGRAIKIAERKRLKPESLARVKVLLQMADGLPAAVTANLNKAVAAIDKHAGKHVGVTDKVKAEKTKIREAANKEFDKAVSEIQDLLIEGGVKERDIVVGQSMMGKSVVVKLPSGLYISITKADAARMKTARASLVE